MRVWDLLFLVRVLVYNVDVRVWQRHGGLLTFRILARFDLSVRDKKFRVATALLALAFILGIGRLLELQVEHLGPGCFGR